MSIEKRLADLETSIHHLQQAVGPDLLHIKNAKRVGADLESAKTRYDIILDRLKQLIDENTKRINSKGTSRQFTEINQRLTELDIAIKTLQKGANFDQLFLNNLRKHEGYRELKDQLKGTVEQLAQQGRTIAQLETELKEKDQQIKALKQDHKGNDTSSELDKIKQQNTRFEGRLTKLQSDYASQQNELQKKYAHKEDHDQLSKSIRKLTDKVQKLQTFQQEHEKEDWDIQDSIDEKLEKNRKLGELTIKISGFEATLQDLTEKSKEEITSEIAAHEEKITTEFTQLIADEKTAILNDVVEALSDWDSRIKALEEQHVTIEEIKNQLDSLEKLRALFNDYVKEVKQYENEQKKLNHDITKREEETKEEMEKINSSIRDKRQLIDELQQSVKTLEIRVAALWKVSSTAEQANLDEQTAEDIAETPRPSEGMHLGDVIERELYGALNRIKENWLDELRFSLVEDKQNFGHPESILTREDLLKEFERLLAEKERLKSEADVSFKVLDDAVSLVLREIKEVKDDLKAVVRREEVEGFDEMFDIVAARILSLEKKITQSKTDDTTSVQVIGQERQSTDEGIAKADSGVLWDKLVYYASQPNVDGVFINSKVGTSLKRGKTIYQIRIGDRRATEAELHLVNDPETLKVAHNAPDTFLTACEFKYSDIKQLIPSNTRPGKVIWDGKNWKLEKRILVE